MTAHTPSPLTFEPLRSDDGLGYIVDANGREVSHHGVKERSRDENIANGNLFAAAPDLLGALKFVLAFYEPGQNYLDTNAWKQAEASARAAVAKAESNA